MRHQLSHELIKAHPSRRVETPPSLFENFVELKLIKMVEKNKNEFRIFDDMEDALEDNFEFWEVDEEGNITSKSSTYEIPKERLDELNWLSHILQKNEKSREKEFYFAYIKALKNAGYKSIVIDLNDINNLEITK